MGSIVLVRACRTDFDGQHRVLGALNLPPLDESAGETSEVAADLTTLDVESIVVGPHEPALQTATQLGTLLNIPVRAMPELGNVSLGLWEGLQIAEVQRKFPKLYRQFTEPQGPLCGATPPQGESVSAALSRIARPIARWLQRDENVCVVACEPLASLIADTVRGVPVTHVPLERAERPVVEVLNNSGANGSGQTPAQAETRPVPMGAGAPAVQGFSALRSVFSFRRI